MGMKKIGGRLLDSGHVESAWKVPGKFGGKCFAKCVGMGFAKLRGYVGVESAWKVRGKCVESAWKVRGKLGVERSWKVCGKFEGMGVESAWKVGGCEKKEGWVRWYYRDR